MHSVFINVLSKLYYDNENLTSFYRLQPRFTCVQTELLPFISDVDVASER